LPDTCSTGAVPGGGVVFVEVTVTGGEVVGATPLHATLLSVKAAGSAFVPL
jgi:hypothetical protein